MIHSKLGNSMTMEVDPFQDVNINCEFTVHMGWVRPLLETEYMDTQGSRQGYDSHLIVIN